ncbi:MAG: LCP family protein [Clostridia bacterium]|nr:LCP family protein [Clostridia bacterium]
MSKQDDYQPRHASSQRSTSSGKTARNIPQKQRSSTKPTYKKPAKKKKQTAEPVRKTRSKKETFGDKLKYFWRHRTKKQKTIIIVVALLIVVLLVVGIFVWSKLSLLGTADEEPVAEVTEEVDMEGLEDLADALNGIIKNWAQNDEKKMSSKDVKNILLIGLDSVSGCTDSMIIASVNEKTQKITLASLYRDSYTYIVPKKGSPTYGKLNWAYSKGGISVLLSTIENNYKVKIDDYAIVNYQTFPKVINALGGVDVYVTEKEATFLNETWYEWSLTGNAQPKPYVTGTNHLDGEMALTFCRIRKLDSDINRTERQRRVITSTLSSMKNASLSQLNNVVNNVFPYITTDMSKTTILGYAGDAITSGWLKYDIEQMAVPSEKLCKSGYAGSQWIWIVDYPAAAQELQKTLYGTTTIEIDPDRVSVLY